MATWGQQLRALRAEERKIEEQLQAIGLKKKSLKSKQSAEHKKQLTEAYQHINQHPQVMPFLPGNMVALHGDNTRQIFRIARGVIDEGAGEVKLVIFNPHGHKLVSPHEIYPVRLTDDNQLLFLPHYMENKFAPLEKVGFNGRQDAFTVLDARNKDYTILSEGETTYHHSVKENALM